MSRPEFILCSAIYVDTGKAEPPRRSYAYPKTGLVFAGWRHSDCFVTMNAWKAGLWFWQRWAIERVQPRQLRGKNQGFTTSKGRYVNRLDAMVIAKASGQIDPLYDTASLYSEDLY